MKEKEEMQQLDEVDVEQIMQQIRAGIIQQQAAERGHPPIVSAHGQALPAAFYEHLFLAGLRYDRLAVALQVSRTPIPIVGRWLERLRINLHRVVIRYVNELAARQQLVNASFLRTLDTMAARLEEEAAVQAERDRG